MQFAADDGLLLDDQTVDFIQRRVSINLATTDDNNMPALTRAFGCVVVPESRKLTVFILRRHNHTVIENVRTNRAIAVTFSRPGTHKTIQFKGTDAEIVAVRERDIQAVRAYRASMIEELQSIGYPSTFVEALIPPPELVDAGIRFTPLDAFNQTPGPRAGRKVSL